MKLEFTERLKTWTQHERWWKKCEKLISVWLVWLVSSLPPGFIHVLVQVYIDSYTSKDALISFLGVAEVNYVRLLSIATHWISVFERNSTRIPEMNHLNQSNEFSVYERLFLGGI